MTDEEIRTAIVFQLLTKGSAQLRTGDRRNVSTARSILRSAAESAGLEVTTSKQDGFVLAELQE